MLDPCIPSESSETDPSCPAILVQIAARLFEIRPVLVSRACIRIFFNLFIRSVPIHPFRAKPCAMYCALTAYLLLPAATSDHPCDKSGQITQRILPTLRVSLSCFFLPSLSFAATSFHTPPHRSPEAVTSFVPSVLIYFQLFAFLLMECSYAHLFQDLLLPHVHAADLQPHILRGPWTHLSKVSFTPLFCCKPHQENRAKKLGPVGPRL